MSRPVAVRAAARIPVPALLALVWSPAARAQSSVVLPGPESADYRELDDVAGAWVNLNVPPVRPLAHSADFSTIWALNAHDSRLVRFTYATALACGVPPEDVAAFDLPWLPVACGLWTDPDDAVDPGRVLVACAGTHALAFVRASDGTIVELLPLDSEPGDLLIDEEAHVAYVSLPTVDALARIDLREPDVVQTWAVRSKNPLFLSWIGGPGERDVLVTPLVSGNNSVVHKREEAPKRPVLEKGILDLEVEAPTGALPDEDLFRLDTASGTLTAVAKRVGTVLFGHGVHPGDGRVWVLNQEALNKDPLRQSEESIRGAFALNRATLVAFGSGDPVLEYVVLDQPAESGGIDPQRTVGQPWSLDFVPAGEPGAGRVLVVGVQTDNVTAFEADGTFAWNLALPAGSIPRAVRYVPALDGVLVHCWGTNSVLLVSDLQAETACVRTLPLGFDPAPAEVQAGRAVFYDASNSQFNTLTCATCHVEGRTDLEEWNLSKLPHDDKGPMVTQTLAGIDRLLTFHWRGEQQRGLEDFNPAFEALLGGQQLGAEDFARFERFVLSIQASANPNQSPWRVVDNDFSPPAPLDLPPGSPPVARGDAVEGQRIWFDEVTVGMRSCNDCHPAPTGSNNDIVIDSAEDPLPKRKFFLSTGFNEMWRREQEVVEVTFLNPQPPNASAVQRYPLLGTGFSHGGTIDSLFEFANQSLNETPAETQMAVDVAAFLHQWDSGMAPAAHRSMLLAQETLTEAFTFVDDYLILQAEAGWADIAVFGTVNGSYARWFYDRELDRFVADDRTTKKPLSFFYNKAAQGLARNVFLGLPLGSGERFAVDFDGDDLYNREEATLGTDPYTVDWDGDTFRDGHEVRNGSDPKLASSTPTDVVFPTVTSFDLRWITTKQARLQFTTDEPTTFELTYSPSTGGTATIVSGLEPGKLHSVVLTDLLPSTIGVGGAPSVPVTYSGTLVVRDLKDNATTYLPGSHQTQAFTEHHVLGGPNTSVAAPGVVLIARVLILRANTTVPEISATFVDLSPVDDDDSFAWGDCDGIPAAPPMPGPFLISDLSDAGGLVALSFEQAGLNPGDKLALCIEAGGSPSDGYDPTDPCFENLDRWSFADTKKQRRLLVFSVP
jgi:hypothetical protein